MNQRVSSWFVRRASLQNHKPMSLWLASLPPLRRLLRTSKISKKVTKRGMALPPIIFLLRRAGRNQHGCCSPLTGDSKLIHGRCMSASKIPIRAPTCLSLLPRSPTLFKTTGRTWNAWLVRRALYFKTYDQDSYVFCSSHLFTITQKPQTARICSF